MDAIRQAVEEAKAEGVPSDIEERESFFMSEVARGETMCADRECPHRTSYNWLHANCV
jgi:import receptor subunit TOM20